LIFIKLSNQAGKAINFRLPVSDTKKFLDSFAKILSDPHGVIDVRSDGLALPQLGSCLECGGNSLATISEQWDLDLIRRRGQG
jgi:hypothetical protein